MSTPWRARSLVACLLGIILLYTTLYLVEARPLTIVQLVDYWFHLEKARSLTLYDPKSLIDPFYPLGYFALLRLGLESGFDIARYGQLLSGVGGLCALIGVYFIIAYATQRPILAFFGAFIFLAHPFFRLYAMREGTDMLSAGLQTMTIALFFMADGRHERRLIAVAGLLLGLAYLIRYTALILVPVGILFIMLKYKRPNRGALVSIAVFLITFLLAALPQLISAVLATGTPFYNQQARNVWFGIYGGFNWVENWAKIPADVTLVEVISHAPARFLEHWLAEFGRFFAYQSGAGLMDQPLALERNVTFWNPLLNHLLWLVSGIFLLIDPRLKFAQKVLLLTSLLFPVLVMSMAWLFGRFLLLALALQATLIALALTQIAQRLNSHPRHQAMIAVTLIVIQIGLFSYYTNWEQYRARAVDMARRNAEIEGILEAAGITDPRQVLSNNRLLQITDMTDHPRLLLMQYHGNDGSLSVDEFLDHITREQTAEYLLFDWSSHAIAAYDYAPYRSKLSAAQHRLRMLYDAPDYTLYCQLPCNHVIEQ